MVNKKTPSLFTGKEFQMYDVQNRIVVMGFEEPQSFFKTANNCLERLGQFPDSYYKKFDLDIDDGPRLFKNGGSTIGWMNTSSEQMNREASLVKKRPSSVSSSGLGGGKGSGRSFADTHSTTIATNQGVSDI